MLFSATGRPSKYVFIGILFYQFSLSKEQFPPLGERHTHSVRKRSKACSPEQRRKLRAFPLTAGLTHIQGKTQRYIPHSWKRSKQNPLHRLRNHTPRSSSHLNATCNQ